MNQCTILAVCYSLPNNLSRAINSTHKSLAHCYYMTVVSERVDSNTYRFNLEQIGLRGADVVRYSHALRKACQACRPIF